MAKKDKEKAQAVKAIATAPLTEKQRKSLQKDLTKYSKSGNNVTKAELKKIKTKIDKYTKALTSSTIIETPVTESITVTTATSTSPTLIPIKDNIISLSKDNNDVSEITALVFEKLGAVELTKFTRNDTVDGINPYYNIISNLSAIKREYDPSNIISDQKSDDSLYNAFSIKLENKIPGDEYLADRGIESYVYIDDIGNLVIELVNITSDELVELEIDTNGTIVEVR